MCRLRACCARTRNGKTFSRTRTPSFLFEDSIRLLIDFDRRIRAVSSLIRSTNPSKPQKPRKSAWRAGPGRALACRHRKNPRKSTCAASRMVDRLLIDLVALSTDPRRLGTPYYYAYYEASLRVHPSYLRVESSSHACQLKATIEKTS